MLHHIHKSTEMGREGILSVLGSAKDAALRTALEQQLTEYEQMMGSSARLLEERGKTPKGVPAAAKLSARMTSAVKTWMDPSPSKIAEMMVQGNTMGMTKSLKHLHDYHGKDERVRDLANKLLKTEEANIQQMKKFL
jgi:ferritin-like protein